MLEPVKWKEGERSLQFGQFVHYCDRLPGVFRARMKQLEAIHRWLGSYFEAVGIMLQIPGAAEYAWLSEVEDDAGDFIWEADRDMLFSILGEAFERLDASSLIDQVPGVDAYRPCKLPVELRLMLAERDRNGVMNIAAECLDRLMVIPDLGEEERRLYEPFKPRPRGLRRDWRSALRYLRRLFRRGGKPCTS